MKILNMTPFRLTGAAQLTGAAHGGSKASKASKEASNASKASNAVQAKQVKQSNPSKAELCKQRNAEQNKQRKLQINPSEAKQAK